MKTSLIASKLKKGGGFSRRKPPAEGVLGTIFFNTVIVTIVTMTVVLRHVIIKK